MLAGMTPISRAFGVALGATTLIVAPIAHADEKPVATSADLVAAIASAQPGDAIVLAAGTYDLGNVSCSTSGTADAPIVVRSATPLGALIRFSGVEGFKVSGAHWHFEGLDIQGVCATDDECEHAFHVFGGNAEGFVLRRSRVRDFNAQLKVNAAPDANGLQQMANGGRVEFCEIADTHPRATANPVTKLNIDGGLGWVVRGNAIHDFRKAGGNEISYGAFMKSGGKAGLFERNLVVCSKDDNSGGVRIGLSFGGGGTAPQFCAPAFDANVPCSVEHTDGVMRNNIIVACSDVGVYVNRGANTKLLHNTLVSTSGIDFRFDTTTGVAHGNLLMGKIRGRDGGSFSESDNRAELGLDFFTALYTNPMGLDFAVQGDATGLQVASPHPDVTNDYCARPRPGSDVAIGALEHALGDCAIDPPDEGSASSGAGGAGGGSSGEGGANATSTASGTGSGFHVEDTGCGCVVGGRATDRPGLRPLAVLMALGAALRRIRSRSRR